MKSKDPRAKIVELIRDSAPKGPEPKIQIQGSGNILIQLAPALEGLNLALDLIERVSELERKVQELREYQPQNKTQTQSEI